MIHFILVAKYQLCNNQGGATNFGLYRSTSLCVVHVTPACSVTSLQSMVNYIEQHSGIIACTPEKTHVLLLR